MKMRTSETIKTMRTSETIKKDLTDCLNSKSLTKKQKMIFLTYANGLLLLDITHLLGLLLARELSKEEIDEATKPFVSALLNNLNKDK